MPSSSILKVVALAALLGLPTLAAAEDNKPVPACRFTSGDSCPWGEASNLTLDGKDLSDSSYKAVHMHGTSLKKTNLERVNFQTADLSSANLAGANLKDGTLFAANATGANFAGADLSGVNLTRADLTKANLQGAVVNKMTLFIHTILDGATWTDGRICAAGSLGECK